MAEEKPTTSTITEELSKMGKLVAQAAQAAWESEERKKLEAEVTEGLRKISEELAQAARKAAESDAAKQLKTQAEKLAGEIKETDVTDEIRKGLIAGLEVINQALGKLVERLEVEKKEEPSAGGEAEKPTESNEPLAQ